MTSPRHAEPQVVSPEGLPDVICVCALGRHRWRATAVHLPSLVMAWGESFNRDRAIREASARAKAAGDNLELWQN